MSVLGIPNMDGDRLGKEPTRSSYRNADRSGKPAHRADRCGKVAMVRLCQSCGAVAWGVACNGCGAKTDGNGSVDVRQGSLRHLRAVLAARVAAGELSEDVAARIVAEMLGVE